MKRRKFLKDGSFASLSIAALVAINTKVEGKTKQINPNDLYLLEATIDDLQQKMKEGVLTAKQITEWYLQRIQKIDKSGPMLNSIIELNPDAVAIAETLDLERSNGKIRGSLHGIPVLLKDNINTADKMMTTAGSLALVGNIAQKDAHIVSLLREAGAVILGKTNLSEFANFRSTNSTSAWSSRGGQTKMPYALNRNPSGSSAGTGTAIAANLAAIGIGTETDGSIVSPSSVNGLVGIKPTVGLWSRSGIIPISHTQDTAGPMCRTVKDAAILLGALSGIDDTDKITKNSKGKSQKDYTKFCVLDGLKGKRIGIEKSFFEGNSYVVDLLKKTIEILKEQGAIIIEIDLLKEMKNVFSAETLVLEYEFRNGLNNYLKTANAKVKNLKEIIEFNKKNETTTMPFFKQELLEISELKSDINSKEYKDALAKSTSAKTIINNIFKKNKLDAFGGTTNGLATCIDLVNGDYYTGFSLSTPPACAGYPHITVPMGLIHELPIGFSFFAKAYQEGKLISMAYHFEQVTKKRSQPKFLESV